jgi:hypothetical protein
MANLSKSEFKLAMQCPTKLAHKKAGYKSSTEFDPYMNYLSDGGYMIGKMAQLYYPEGIEINGNTEQALAQTALELLKDKVVLFEPAIQVNNKLVRIDILVKDGNHFQLIEVKSKSYDSLEHQEKGDAYFKATNWKSYLEDVTYQQYVLQDQFPEAKIDAFILMPDKSIKSEIDEMITWFHLTNISHSTHFREVAVQFTGDAEKLRAHPILKLVSVNKEVAGLMPNVIKNATVFIDSLLSKTPIITPISIKCKACNYTVRDEDHLESGFEKCWGALAVAHDENGNKVPHILELGQLGNLNPNNCLNELIEEGKVAMADVPLEVFYKPTGEVKYNGRPMYQATENTEFLKSEFKEVLTDLQYPLYFLDFETSQMAIPFHAGMKPYDKVMFQWSCHVIKSPGAEPEHFEWINTHDVYPNQMFIQSLYDLIGYNGTIMSWSNYENTQLKTMLNVFEASPDAHQFTELINWLNVICKRDKLDHSNIIDMNDLAIKYYFHPIMKGQTTIKLTLPAVLTATNSSRIKNWLSAENLLLADEHGKITNPYNLLPYFEMYNKSENVKDGTGAMRAYQDMLYGADARNETVKQEYKNALLKYCKLDTLAMLIIWEHWCDLVEL